MIDIHSHIIPGIDDGAADMEESLKMLRMSAEDGNNGIIATSHYYRNLYENSFEDIKNFSKALSQSAKDHDIDIKIYPGQEIYLDKYTLELIAEGVLKGLNESKYMLVEFSMKSIPQDILNIIYEIRLLGFVPIIGHPERYLDIISKPGKINDFIDEGCLFQINTGSINGIFGKEILETAKTLIDHGICDFIASDAHSIEKRNPAMQKSFITAEKLRNGITAIASNNSLNVISNLDIKSSREKISIKNKSIFSFFKK